MVVITTDDHMGINGQPDVHLLHGDQSDPSQSQAILIIHDSSSSAD